MFCDCSASKCHAHSHFSCNEQKLASNTRLRLYWCAKLKSDNSPNSSFFPRGSCTGRCSELQRSFHGLFPGGTTEISPRIQAILRYRLLMQINSFESRPNSFNLNRKTTTSLSFFSVLRDYKAEGSLEGEDSPAAS